MSAAMKYRLNELHTGMTIRYPWIVDRRESRQMYVTRVIYRLGRGLILIGTAPDGYSTMHMPHPDDEVEVLSRGGNIPPDPRESSRDFPHAEVVR